MFTWFLQNFIKESMEITTGKIVFVIDSVSVVTPPCLCSNDNEKDKKCHYSVYLQGNKCLGIATN